MAISEEDVDAANRRAVQTKAKHAVATKVRYDVQRKRIVLHLESSGLGLHFPELDADLYLSALGVRDKAQAARSNGARGGRPKTPVSA